MRGVGKFLLHIQTGGATAALFRHQSAEGVLVLISLLSQLPDLDRPQGQGQTGRFPERALVILIDFGTGKLLE